MFFSEPGVLYWTKVYFSWCLRILERKYPTHPYKNTFTSLFMYTRMKDNILCGFNKINIIRCLYEDLKHIVQVIFPLQSAPKELESILLEISISPGTEFSFDSIPWNTKTVLKKRSWLYFTLDYLQYQFLGVCIKLFLFYPSLYMSAFIRILLKFTVSKHILYLSHMQPSLSRSLSVSIRLLQQLLMDIGESRIDPTETGN